VSSQRHKPCIQPLHWTRLQGSCPVNATSLVSILYIGQNCKDRVQSTPQALYPACTLDKIARIVSSQCHKHCIRPVLSLKLQGSCPVNATSLVSSLYIRQGCKDRVQSTPQALYPSCTINKFARIVASQCHKPCIKPVQSRMLQGSCPVKVTCSRPVQWSHYYSQYLSSQCDPVTSHCICRQLINLQRRKMLFYMV